MAGDDHTVEIEHPAPQKIPPVVPPKRSAFFFWNMERDDRNQLERDGSQSHNIRRASAYGALILALLLYGCGVFAIAVFLGLVPRYQRATADMWHIVLVTLGALFTVPTVLVLAVLKLAGGKKADDKLPDSFHEALGKMVQKVFEKLAGGIGGHD